jgi:acetyl-CoA carboxylase biotin carboxyl carrier protein
MSKKAIADAAKMMDETGLMEITSEYSIFLGLFKRRIHLSKQNICVANAAIGASNDFGKTQKIPENPNVHGAITSPMVGIAYLAPEPNAKPFTSVGKNVSEGDTLCLIEAMKTFNPIKAPKSGVISEILVQDGEVVEFGTPLIVIK